MPQMSASVQKAVKRLSVQHWAQPYPVGVTACAQSLNSVRLLRPPWTGWGPPGFSVHGILQARILEWVALFFSKGSSWPRDRTCVSYVSCIDTQIL